MTLVRVKRPADSVADALASLNEQVLHTVSRRRFDQLDLVRVEVALKPFDLLGWLASQRSTMKCYWRDRDHGTEYAGIGAVETVIVSSLNEVRTCVERIADANRACPLRWYGGLPFDLERARDADAPGLGVGQFVLPGIDAEIAGDAATLGCNVSVRDRNLYSRLACLGDIDRNAWNEPEAIVISERRESPDRKTWEGTVERVLAQIAAGTISKLVPARQAICSLNQPLNPWRALARLKAQGGVVSVFGFQTDDNHAFIGASPERLFKRHGRTIDTEAIAGTTSRGATPEEDARLHAELLQSGKDRREHELVTNYLCQSLEPLTGSLVVDKTSVLTLPQLQHLKTSIRGTLHDSVSDSDLLAALHPTPAVAGLPREKALQLIREIEPFDRGWYAGPVGWMSGDAAEFAVAIRSVLVAGNQLILTAGAGVVEGSDPRAEWEETERKIRSTLDIILP